MNEEMMALSELQSAPKHLLQLAAKEEKPGVGSTVSSDSSERPPEPDNNLVSELVEGKIEEEIEEIKDPEEYARRKLAELDWDPEEDFRPEGVKTMDHEVWEKYFAQCKASEGFDIKDYPGLCPAAHIAPIRNSAIERDHDLASELVVCGLKALDVYNEERGYGPEYEFVKVVKVTHMVVSGSMYFLTFKGKQKGADIADLSAVKDFQAKVWVGIKHVDVLFCREAKPPPF